MTKPFSQACENNKQYILDKLLPLFSAGSMVLEIGTLTAQHICYFAEAMPLVYWIPSDLDVNLPTVLAGLEDSTLPNISAPLELDVADEPWAIGQVDGLFTANTLHIMRYDYVERFFRNAGSVLKAGGVLCVYGPFKKGGEFTTPSNASFDVWLKQRDPLSGVRDVEQVQLWAAEAGLELLADHNMPANNQMLIWRKQTTQ
jgi:SAM-dependent methyltransferase